MFEDDCLDFTNRKTVLVNKDLYTFKEGKPVSTYKIANFTSSAHLVKTTLAILPGVKCLVSFSVSLIMGKIILTGGIDSRCVKSAHTYVMDLKMNRWQQNPDLNQARRGHSSMSLVDKTFVACGWDNDDVLFNSVEML